MSEPKEYQPSPMYVTSTIIGGIVVPMLLVAIVAKVFIAPSQESEEVPAAKVAAVEANIKPVAAVEMASADGPKGPKSGEEVVKAVCSMCHEAGLMGSPKIGDKGSWAPRIAQGYETLVKHAIEGIRSMPARGGNADLTDDEVAGAVAYMANSAGANFKAPEPAAAPAEAAPAEAPKAQ